MDREGLPSIGIIFSQFAAYHVDRCEAAAARLAGRYRVKAIEVATRSADYAWEVSGAVAGAEKVTLFPGLGFEEVNWLRRMRAEYAAVRNCSMVFVGLPYSLPDAIALSWRLRFAGVDVTVMTESKFDDRPRYPLREFGKRLLLGAYGAAVVGARRQSEYMHYLGFRGRPVLPGYDAVGIERIRRQAADAEPIVWTERPFVYVGRFAPKKNLPTLLRAYARYAGLVDRPRRLRLVGDGESRGELEQLAQELQIASLIDWPGFLDAAAVSRELARALALCLVSTEEQWGLVVNEAIALGLPAIVSSPVGSRDALVRDGVNGYVVSPDDVERIAEAMAELSDDPARWQRMAAISAERSWLGDAERFADAIELAVNPTANEASRRLAAFEKEIGLR